MRTHHRPTTSTQDHRFAPMLVIVLVLLTLVNLYVLVYSGQLLKNGSEHGLEMTDPEMRLRVVMLVEAVLSVACLIGVWLRQLSGVHLYVMLKVLVLLLTIAAAPEHVTPMSMMAPLFAGLLWWGAASAGWSSAGSRG